MNIKSLLSAFVVMVCFYSCSNSIQYSEDFKTKTAGGYLYNADDVITISYVDNTLLFDWRGIKTKPVATDTNEFFVPDLYKKLHFVIHPQTGKRYLSMINENNPDSISYDYVKVPKGYKTPSQHLEDKNYEAALQGYLEIKAKDSVSEFIDQYKFNRMGYKYLRDENYKDAIGVFTMNTKLHPTSGNVYDSLADAYARKGDSALAYENYKKALDINNDNKGARKFITQYEKANK